MVTKKLSGVVKYIGFLVFVIQVPLPAFSQLSSARQFIRFDVTPLTSYPATTSVPTGISNSGEIVGFTNSVSYPNRPVRWDAQGIPSIPFELGLGLFYRARINNQNQFIGRVSYTVPPMRSYFYSPNGGVQQILPQGEVSPLFITPANGLNDAGIVVGYGNGNGDPEHPGEHAFAWLDGLYTYLPGLDGHPGTRAWGVDNQGNIVGGANPGGGAFTSRPVKWSVEGEMLPKVIEAQGLPNDVAMEAVDISSDGNYIVVSPYPDGDIGRSYLIKPDGTAQEIKPPSGAGVVDLSVNNRGEVIGRYSPTGILPGPLKAFFRAANGRSYDMDALANPTGWQLGAVADINDNGVIVGWGTRAGSTSGVVIYPRLNSLAQPAS